MTVTINILGGFSTPDDLAPEAPWRPKCIRVLVELVVARGRVVSLGRLEEAVWGDEPPLTATRQIRKLVAEARKRFPGSGDFISSEHHGYRIDPTACASDYDTLRRRIDVVHAGRLSAEEETAALKDLLDRWAPILPTDTSDALERLRRSEHARMTAACVALIRSHLGRNQWDIAESALRSLLYDDPHSESLTGLLMRVTYALGRPAEALGIYDSLRSYLAEELGVDPSPELQSVHQRILRNDESLQVAQEATGPLQSDDTSPDQLARAEDAPSIDHGPKEHAGSAAPQTTVPVPSSADEAQWSEGHTPGPVGTPRTLPRRIRRLYGRDAELAQITSTLDGGNSVVEISGLGGVGKTSLALAAAHDSARRYPDGQIFVEVGTFRGGSRGPASLGECLAQIFYALGVPAHRLPSSLQSRVDMWRSVSATNAILLVVDDVGSVETAQALVPTGPNSAVVFTSRMRLNVLESDQLVELGPLSAVACRNMLRDAMGPGIDTADDSTMHELFELTGRCPLGMVLAARQLQRRPSANLHDTVQQLRGDAMAEGTGLETSTAWSAVHSSVQSLPTSVRKVATTIATWPVSSAFTWQSVAAYSGITPEDARASMRVLLHANIVQDPRPGLFTLHDVVREYLAARNDGQSCPVDTAEARTRLSSFLTQGFARHAANWGAVEHRLPPTPMLEFDEELFGPREPQHGNTWMAQHVGCADDLVLQESSPHPESLVALATWTSVYWIQQGAIEHVVHVNESALEHAAASRDVTMQQTMHASLAVLLLLHGRPSQGQAHVAAALGDAMPKDTVAAQRARDLLALHEASTGSLERALAEWQARHEDPARAFVTDLSGDAHLYFFVVACTPNARNAYNHLRQTAIDETGSESVFSTDAIVANTVARLMHATGDFDAARKVLAAAAALHQPRPITDWLRCGLTAWNCAEFGDHSVARQHVASCPDDVVDLSAHSGPTVLVYMATAAATCGDYSVAERLARQALEAATLTEVLHTQAAAHTIVSVACAAMGRTQSAEESAAQALAITGRIGGTVDWLLQGTLGSIAGPLHRASAR